MTESSEDGVALKVDPVGGLPPHGTQDRYLVLQLHARRWRTFAETFGTEIDDDVTEKICRGCASAFAEYCVALSFKLGGSPSYNRDRFRRLEKQAEQLLRTLVDQTTTSLQTGADAFAAMPQLTRLALTQMMASEMVVDSDPLSENHVLEKAFTENMPMLLAHDALGQRLSRRNEGTPHPDEYGYVWAAVDAVVDLMRSSKKIADILEMGVTDDGSHRRRHPSPIVRFRSRMVQVFVENQDAIAGGKGMAGELSDMAGGPLDTFLRSAERFLSDTFDEPLPKRSDTSTKHAYDAYRRAL